MQTPERFYSISNNIFPKLTTATIYKNHTANMISPYFLSKHMILLSLCQCFLIPIVISLTFSIILNINIYIVIVFTSIHYCIVPAMSRCRSIQIFIISITNSCIYPYMPSKNSKDFCLIATYSTTFLHIWYLEPVPE